MSKAAVSALFVGASVAFIAGSVLALAAILAGVSGGVISLGGPQVVTVNGAAFVGIFPWLLGSSILLGVGALAGLASWVAALFNTFQLEDRTWFVALLALGVVSLGWIAMIAYVVAGPDSTNPRQGGAVAVAPLAPGSL